MNFINVKNLIISIGLGLVGFFLVYNEVFFILPGTNLLTDLREIFVTISAALLGPIGGMITGILTSMYDPNPEIILYIIIQHIVPAVLLAIYYKKVIHKKLPMPFFVLGWIVGIFLYYYVFYLPVFIITYLYNPDLFYHLVPDQSGTFNLNSAFQLFKGWFPEFIFTAFFTSLILIALPENYRKPRWGRQEEADPLKVKLAESGFAKKIVFKNSLSVRLAIWFLILAVFPILLLGISIKKDITNSLLENEANTREAIVKEVKPILLNYKADQTAIFLNRVNQNVKGETFLIDTTGKYIFTSDQAKIGKSVFKEVSNSIFNQIISDEYGRIIDYNNNRSIAFQKLNYQSKDLFLISISDPLKIESILSEITYELHKKLFIGLAIISLALIVIIHLIIRIPLRSIKQTIDNISSGKYGIQVDTEILSDEIRSLGFALNSMADKITSSEKKYREMAELLPQTLFECDLNGKLTYANQNGFILFGYTKEDIINGINIFEFIHPRDRLKAGENIKKIFNKEIVKGNEYLAVKKNGDFFPAIIHTTYFEENGEIAGLRGIVVDITSLKQAEETVKASEEKFRTIIQSLQDMIFIAGIDGKMSYVSPSVIKILEYKEEELLGVSAFNFIHPDDITSTLNEFNKVTENTNQGKSLLYRVRKKSGNYIYLESIGINLLSNKFVNGLVIISRDVSERIVYERQLKESEARLKESQKVAKLGHYDFDIKSGMWISSAVLDDIMGIDKTFIHDYQGWVSLLFDEDRNMMIQYLNNHVLKQKNKFNKEYRIVRFSDKKVLWVEGLGNLEFDDEGNPVKMFGTIQDITERKLAQDILFNSEQRFKYIWENTLDAMRLTDETGRILSVNRAYCELVEKPREQLEGKNLSEVFFNDFQDSAQNKYVENFRNKTLPSRYECSLELWNTKVIYVQAAHTYLSISGQPLLLLSVFHNITDKKIAEDYLKQSEEKFRHAFDYSASGVAILNLNGKFQKVNPAFAKMIGYSENEMKKLSFKDITYDEDVVNSSKIFEDLLQGKTNYFSFEKRYLTKNKSIIWGYISTSLVRDSENKPNFFISQIVDITERKNAEESVRKLSTAVEQSPVIIMITDTNGTIIYVNPKFSEVTGYALDEIKGANPKILKSGHSSPDQYFELWSTIKSGKEWRGEFLNKKKNGELYWESAFISPIIDQDGKILNFLAVKEDITEKKKLLAELIEAKQKAEEMNKIKSYFFANMSHELRTPFVGIMGFSELLSESLQNPEENHMAQQIFNSSQRLTDTLNKILNVTRIEFDNLEVKPRNFDICKLINDTVVLFSSSAQIKNTSLRAVYSEKSIIVNTDSKLLEDVLNNLVSNAIKFTDNGTITLNVDTLEEEQKNYLLLKISDTGIGIPKDKQEIVWHEFRQASEGFNRSFEGTGLGLTITKKYVQLLGGDITLESEPGKGTTFTIKIPFSNVETNLISLEKPVSVSKTADKVKYSAKRPRILYVEDDVVSLQYVEIILKSVGEVNTAIDADKALLMAGKNKYDILMLDINLGRGIDGIELLSRIKEIPGYKSVLAVAVTAYASESDKSEFLSKGFTHYISKPFSSNELKDLLINIYS